MTWLQSPFVLVLLGIGACSIDARSLSVGAGGAAAGGAGATPSNDAGKTSASGAGGHSAAAGAGGEASDDGLVDGCADLDTDGVGDCTVTLVKTPTFTDDVSSWTAMADATLSWNAKNALGDAPSGSARLRATSARASAQQCLPLDGRKLVIAYANAFVAQPTDAAHPLQAQLAVAFYAEKSCSGEASGFFETPPSTQSETWVTVQAGGLSDESSRSMSIALVGVKPSTEAKLDAYFDNVMLTAQEL